jgi:adenosylcobinamide-GDP ribazoletransferase
VNLKKAPARGALGRAAGWFPWIGAFIGLAAAAILWCLRMVLPEALAAVLAAALWIAFSGGLHLDGLADCCDGLLNASAPERRLEIMKDPRVGTFGAIGLIIAFSLRAVSLYYLGAAAWLALPLAGALSRWTLCWQFSSRLPARMAWARICRRIFKEAVAARQSGCAGAHGAQRLARFICPDCGAFDHLGGHPPGARAHWRYDRRCVRRYD